MEKKLPYLQGVPLLASVLVQLGGCHSRQLGELPGSTARHMCVDLCSACRELMNRYKWLLQRIVEREH